MLVKSEAATQQTGVVTSIQVNKSYGGGMVAFYIQGTTPIGHPACVTDPTRWVVKTTDGNMLNAALIAALLAAYSTGKQVAVEGTGVCTVIPWAEDINSITVLP
jgi:hypothetical protein